MQQKIFPFMRSYKIRKQNEILSILQFKKKKKEKRMNIE